MTYVRKTRDEWTIQGNYGYGYGWEDLSAYDSLSDAKADLRAYRDNEPEFAHRLVCKRVRLSDETLEMLGRAGVSAERIDAMRVTS